MLMPPDRWVEAKTNQGWGIVALVVGLAIVCIVAVTVVHNRTHKDPTDVSWHGVGGGTSKQAAGH